MVHRPNLAHCLLCVACELKMVVVFFLNNFGKSKDEYYFVTCKSYMKLKFQCS